MTAVKQAPQHLRGIPDAGQGDLRFNRIAGEEGFGHFDHRRRRSIQAQTIARRHIRGGRHLRMLQVINRCIEQQLDDIVRPSRAVDDDLRRDHRIFGVEQQRLFGRQVPGIAKAVLTVAGAKLPE